MKKEQLVAISIPVLFVVGMIVFFMFQTQFTVLNNFIGYMSSLSTIIMVLVYAFTTSRQLDAMRNQLDAMRNQLDEMRFTRNVQSQPVLAFEEAKIQFKLPRFLFKPPTREHIKLFCQMIFTSNVLNIGNSPAIAIDFIPKILSENREKLAEESLGERIECISLTENGSRKILFVVDDSEHKVVETLVNEGVVFLRLTIIYKNILGMPFKQETEFVMALRSQDELKKMKLCLKTLISSEIDFAEKVLIYQSLMEKEKFKKAAEILNALNAELEKIFDEEDEIEFHLGLMSGSFSVGPISESEYKRLVAEKEEMQKKSIAPWKELPWFLRVDIERNNSNYALED